jgi:hypothetical protein
LAFFLDLFPKKIYAIGTCRGGKKKIRPNCPGATESAQSLVRLWVRCKIAGRITLTRL